MSGSVASDVVEWCAAAAAHRQGDEDFEFAQRLVTTVPAAELLVHPGTDHCFAEQDEQADTLLRRRVLAFLGR